MTGVPIYKEGSPRVVTAADRLSWGNTAARRNAAFGAGGELAHKAKGATKENAWRRLGREEVAFPFFDPLGSAEAATDQRVLVKLRPRQSSLKVADVVDPSHPNITPKRDNHSKPLKMAQKHSGRLHQRRSPSIAIQQTREVEGKDGGEQPSASAERMYDWATWNMYTRITEHRRRFPVKRQYRYNYDPSPPPPPQSQPLESAVGTLRGREFRAPDKPLPHQHERFFDGEVFELEL